MKERSDPVIATIASAYEHAASRETISREEVEQYIKSASFFEDIITFSKTAFIVVESQSFRYLYCSANCSDVLGWEADTMLAGGPLFGLNRLVEDDLRIQSQIHPFMVEFINGVPAGDKGRYKFAFTSRLLRADGREVQLLQHNFFVRFAADGAPQVKIITFNDISAFKTSPDVVFYATRMRHGERNEIILQRNFSSGGDISLSTRETDVLRMTGGGASNGEIAGRLGVSENTVKTHKKSICKKLGCANSSQMVALARLYGVMAGSAAT